MPPLHLPTHLYWKPCNKRNLGGSSRKWKSNILAHNMPNGLKLKIYFQSVCISIFMLWLVVWFPMQDWLQFIYIAIASASSPNPDYYNINHSLFSKRIKIILVTYTTLMYLHNLQISRMPWLEIVSVNNVSFQENFNSSVNTYIQCPKVILHWHSKTN